MNKELGEIFKALRVNAIKVEDCILISKFRPFVDCGTSCSNCPLFQGKRIYYISNIITTVEVLNEPRTDRDS